MCSECLIADEQLFPKNLGVILKGNLCHLFYLISIVRFPIWGSTKLDEIVNR